MAGASHCKLRLTSLESNKSLGNIIGVAGNENTLGTEVGAKVVIIGCFCPVCI
jgi:hypothetical protein